jgi:hypothetical protein
MPNHFHGIVENVDGMNINPDAHVDRNVNINFPGKNIAIGLNTNPDAHVGAPLRGRPDDHDTENHAICPNNFVVNNDERGRPDDQIIQNTELQSYGTDNRILGATIGRALDWFRTMTTNEYIRGVKDNGWQRFDDQLGQRNFKIYSKK